MTRHDHDPFNVPRANGAYGHEFREGTEVEREAIKPLPFRPWGNRDLADIRPTEFLYSDFYARGYTSLTAAPPKAGKSMLGLAECVDMATGDGFLTGQPREPLRVLYYNAEDDMSVIEARVAALLCRYQIDQRQIANTLFPVSGVDADGFYMVTGQEGVVNEGLFVALERFIADWHIDVLIFDPLQDLSRSPETNEVFRVLGQRLRKLASGSRVALGLIHHTRKMTPGATATIDDVRGGGALRGTARFNRLLLPMTQDEGTKAGVENHRHFIRIADVEGNLAPPSADVNRWFQKVSVPIPNGQHVGAIEPWKWPDDFMGLRREDAAAVRAAIGACDPPPKKDGQAKNWAGYVIAKTLGLPSTEKADKRRLTSLLKEWVRTGVLAEAEVDDRRAGRSVKVVIQGVNNPMEVVEE
ncbi:AAA family ATPase [Gemmobacter nectariphilus]|uniref:AAA family ATPase n=1 Tax=Gemmobacter nectariphilus TaxID=220343 RepID=UPI0003F7DDBE|nr:AAA family ATPase [Gemmobacter nectariphilus]